MSRTKQHQITIRGVKWKYVVLPDPLYFEKTGEDSDALTYQHRMTFKQTGLTWGTCRHEIRHAYVRTLCVDSAELNADHMEEICAELDDHWGLKMMRDSAKIYLTLMKECGMVVKDELAKHVAKWRIK